MFKNIAQRKVKAHMSYKFVNMGTRPLAYDVRCNTKIVIPAGTRGVRIAFRQSHLFRWDEAEKVFVPMNVYLYKGKLYHA